MKIPIFILLLFSLPIPSSFAEDDLLLEVPSVDSDADASPAAYPDLPKSKFAKSAEGEKLVDLEGSRLNQRLAFLENRLTALEQDLKSQEDRLRRLDRAVEDVRRRH